MGVARWSVGSRRLAQGDRWHRVLVGATCRGGSWSGPRRCGARAGGKCASTTGVTGIVLFIIFVAIHRPDDIGRDRARYPARRLGSASTCSSTLSSEHLARRHVPSSWSDIEDLRRSAGGSASTCRAGHAVLHLAAVLAAAVATDGIEDEDATGSRTTRRRRRTTRTRIRRSRPRRPADTHQAPRSPEARRPGAAAGRHRRRAPRRRARPSLPGRSVLDLSRVHRVGYFCAVGQPAP